MSIFIICLKLNPLSKKNTQYIFVISLLLSLCIIVPVIPKKKILNKKSIVYYLTLYFHNAFSWGFPCIYLRKHNFNVNNIICDYTYY